MTFLPASEFLQDKPSELHDTVFFNHVLQHIILPVMLYM